MKRKICVVTGGRMDYGHLKKVLEEINNQPEFELLVVPCCMHLTTDGSIQRIVEDGFDVTYTIDCLLQSNSADSIAKSVGLASISFADCFRLIKPNLIMIMGDRFELLAAAQTALFMKIPIAHISGGDTTEGAYDEAIRHSITKMSHIHFATNSDAENRIRQLGENPDYIYNVGSPTIDYLKSINYISRTELAMELGVVFNDLIFVITYHPTTLGAEEGSNEVKELILALHEYPSATMIITLSNADNGGSKINELLREFSTNHSNCKVFDALGQYRYYNLLDKATAIIGNSSSGLFEAPSFDIPTVNIGDRQKGRIRSTSVIDCKCIKTEIQASIDRALQLRLNNVKNPYGDGNSAHQIVDTLKSIKNYQDLLQKHFFDYA